MGGAQRPLGGERIDKIGDIVGYNGDGATLIDFQNPGIPNMVSEYGSVTADRPGTYAPGWGDLLKDDGWKGRPWRSGHAIWCGFDHGSIAGSALGKMGIVDYFRIPKRSFYWYRNEYGQVAPPVWPVEGTPVRLKLEATKRTGVLTDGTDDVLLTVTVLGAAGELLSNSPDVQLRVVSGPGEFPTGRSIQFEKESDIRILDGQAAIAFRSYYAGNTVIEATSPGLKPVRVEVGFVGASLYKKGVTPVVEKRPYVRFVRQAQAPVVQTFGCNNPTFASSQQPGKGAGLAADGNVNTYWQPTQSDKAPYWMLDTEKGLTLHRVSVRFPKAAVYRYVIEASDDKELWNVLMDKRNAVTPEQHIEILLANGEKTVTARFLRIRFLPESSAAVAEVEVNGVVRE